VFFPDCAVWNCRPISNGRCSPGFFNWRKAWPSRGREGKPVGAIFVLGDYAKVLTKSRQLIINPFKGYPRQQRSILDPVLDETIKEFAKIDGAFLISGDGVIESAGTFIAGQPESASHRPGLGSRHAAALGITAVTASIAVVISESTRKISVFQNGRHFELD
jgi:diadenylate cyclase